MRVARTGFFHETNWFGNLLVTSQVLKQGTVDGSKPIEQYAPGIHSVDLNGVPLEHANKSYYPLGDPEWNI